MNFKFESSLLKSKLAKEVLPSVINFNCSITLDESNTTVTSNDNHTVFFSISYVLFTLPETSPLIALSVCSLSITA